MKIHTPYLQLNPRGPQERAWETQGKLGSRATSVFLFCLHLRRDDSGDRKDKEYFPPKHWAVRGEPADLPQGGGGGGGGGGGYHHHRARSKNPDRQRYQQEDPYYHGLSARVPVFPVSKQDKESHNFSEASRWEKLSIAVLANTKYFQAEISQPRSCTTARAGCQCLVALQALSGDRDSKRLVNLCFIRMDHGEEW